MLQSRIVMKKVFPYTAMRVLSRWDRGKRAPTVENWIAAHTTIGTHRFCSWSRAREILVRYRYTEDEVCTYWYPTIILNLLAFS